MIVPRSRLLFWTAVVVLPFALLAAVVPSAGVVSLGFIGALAAIVLADAASAGRSLAGLDIQLPPVSRMSKDREANMEIRIRNGQRRARLLRVALAMPRAFEAKSETVDLSLPADAEWSRLLWTCRPRERGNHHAGPVYAEAASLLGFWSARKTLAASGEVRVYPNLLHDRKNLAAVFLHRGWFGLHAQRQVGKGRDFEKLREYIPGDSFDEIHWKATAKRGHPITKVFQIERTQEVYVVLDASRLSAREVQTGVQGSRFQAHGLAAARGAESPPGALNCEPATPVLERFITAALVLGLAAEQQGDLFGLLTFSDRVERFVRAKNGKAHYHACRDALYTLRPKTVTPDFDELCMFIRLRLRRRALLVVLTSLDDPALAESFVRNLKLIRRQHLILVNMLQPPGAHPLFTNPNIAATDDLYRHLGGHLLWRRLRELGKVLQRHGAQFSLLENERLSAELVSQYLNVKRRQLL